MLHRLPNYNLTAVIENFVRKRNDRQFNLRNLQRALEESLSCKEKTCLKFSFFASHKDLIKKNFATFHGYPEEDCREENFRCRKTFRSVFHFAIPSTRRTRKRQQEVVECLLKLMSGTRLRKEIIKERDTTKDKKEMISIMLMLFEAVCLIFSFIYAPLRLFCVFLGYIELGAASCQHVRGEFRTGNLVVL